jgi:Cu(I)/Ag(I) efflux system membrane fusion protein
VKHALPLVAIAGALLVTATVAYRVGRQQAPPAAATPATSAAVLYWYDPMVPDQHFPKAGLSPMGMQMVPKFATGGGEHDTVRVDATTTQNLGVRIAPVARHALATGVTAPASIRWDPRQAVIVSARVDAIVNRLYVRAPYTTVASGAPLADLIAPQWTSAIAEYRALQHMQSADARALRDAGRERLRMLGLSSADVASAGAGDHASGITTHAPRAGIVTSLDVREGQRVTAGQTLMTINGQDTVWVEAALPQASASIVSSGTPVTVRVDALAGRVFHGIVETMLPDIDATTRTQVARIVLANPDGVLRPGMFATVRFEPAAGSRVLVVPDEALLTTGSRAHVIVSTDGGRFRPVVVRTGRSAEGYTEILSGLEEGDKVVVSGQFLIDSEASLSGALDRLDQDTAAPADAGTAAMPGDHP